ncbi:19527_t:CDS:1, partial [Gigaspora margarita]
ELTLDEHKSKYFPGVMFIGNILDRFPKQIRELKNSDKATKTYNIMKWKPEIPIHSEAVYKSRMTRQNDMVLQYVVSNISEVDEIINHDG